MITPMFRSKMLVAVKCCHNGLRHRVDVIGIGQNIETTREGPSSVNQAIFMPYVSNGLVRQDPQHPIHVGTFEYNYAKQA